MSSLGDISPILLIITPLALLIGPGILYNNFSANDFLTPVIPYTGGLCPAFITDPTQGICPAYDGTYTAPCQLNATKFCSLNTAVTFLNPYSPFTYILTGDVIGFVSSFGQGPQVSSSYDINAVTGCKFKFSNSTSPSISGTSNNALSGTCKSAAWNYPNPPLVGGQSCQCFNVTSNGGNDSTWLIFGAIQNYFPNGTAISGSAFNAIGTVQMFAFLVNNTDSSSTCAVAFNNANQCAIFRHQETSSGFTNILQFIGFMGGAIMLVMSLGIYFQASAVGTGFSFGLNPQGTKFVQIFGIGLFIWIPMLSEFANWTFQFTLGVGAIILLFFSVIYFMGLYFIMGGATSGGTAAKSSTASSSGG